MREGADDFIPTRQSLLSRLRDWDDRESWRDFFDTYGRFIYRIAHKSGLNDAEAQDVVQETLIAVAKQMPEFKYDPAIGSFKGWLHQITRRRVVDHLRKRSPELQIGSLEPSGQALDRLADPAGSGFESLWEEEWQKHIFHTAIQRVKRRTQARQFQMFDLYVTQQWPIKTVMSTLGVNAAQVYMAKMRISKMIKGEVKLLKSQMR